MDLSMENLAVLLGDVPSRQSMIELGLEDLVPVLEQIGRLQPELQPDLRPVPADKLERNLLSAAVETLLHAGMSRATLVRKYFKRNPELRDQLAETFRKKYQELRATRAAPDDTFVALQKFAGGNQLSSPSHQSAVLACLAFFFEECEIFERPDTSGDTSS